MSHELERDRRAAMRDYRGSLMSNAKWRAVLSALENPALGIRQLVVKFTDSEEERRMQLPWLEAPRAFVDSIEFGPFPLASIEWVEVPAIAIFPRANNVPPERHLQDLLMIRATLEALGKKLPLRDTATGLRIIGHVR